MLSLVGLAIPTARASGQPVPALPLTSASAPVVASTVLPAARISPALAASASAGSTPQADAPATSSITTQLDAIQARLPLLRAQKEAADLERVIREANQVKDTSPGALPSGSGIAAPVPTATTPLPAGTTSFASVTSKHADAPAADLTLAGAGAFNGTWVATLTDSEGSAYDVRVGNVLPSGWKVTHIDPLGVLLERGRQRRTITTLAGAR
ncbi:MAG: type IV pilus biogenesis protein PilP [Burkholderia sp.]